MKFFFLLSLFTIVSTTAIADTYENNKHETVQYADFVLRVLSQGGFSDDRSPSGVLGGGQLALDIKPVKSPFALSISGEYYTNGPDPTHKYEISGAFFVNALYMSQLPRYKKARYFFGGGLGGVTVPRGENQPGKNSKSIAYDLEAGINVLIFWKIGFYGVAKYLYAQKFKDGNQLIDFKEKIILLGLTYNFSW
jgi:hypothetical protein